MIHGHHHYHRRPFDASCRGCDVNVTLEVPDELLPQLEQRVAAIVLAQLDRELATRWLNVDRAADYLSTTPEAIRGLVKRQQLPVHRTPSGRLLFDPVELDAWVRDAD